MTQGHSRLGEICTCDREGVRGQTWRNPGLRHLLNSRFFNLKDKEHFLVFY